MKISSGLTIASATINLVIFIYFIIVLSKMNALELFGLSVSALGILTSLIANIVTVLDN